MIDLRCVVVPIDFSPLSEAEIEVAVGICRAFCARLVLHHNVERPDASFSRVWDWQQGRRRDRTAATDAALSAPRTPEARLQAIVDRLPAEVTPSAVLSHGATTASLLTLAAEAGADLIVLGCHGRSHEDHTSVTEQVIERSRCPVLTIADPQRDLFALRILSEPEAASVLVPTDFSPNAMRAARFTFDLARLFPVRVELLHVLPAGRSGEAGPPAGPGNGAAPRAAALERLLELVPADLEERTDVAIRAGLPWDEIVAHLGEGDFDLVVMGQHARGFFRRHFTRDTSRELLHRAVCPVWFVPAG